MIVDMSAPTVIGSRMFQRSDVMSMYFADIRKYTPPTKEEEIELFTKLGELKDQLCELSKMPRSAEKQELLKKKTDEVNAVKHEIAAKNQRFVVAVAKKFATNATIMDIIEEGNIGLMEAIDSFDLSKGAKFSTWAVFLIRRAINRYCVETAPSIRQTNRIMTYHTKASAINKFQQKHHRMPSDEELMDFMNENYSYNIKNTSDLVDVITSSIDEVDDDGIQVLSDVRVYEASIQSDTEKGIDKAHTVKLIKRLLHVLTDRERFVVERYFGIGVEREYEIVEISESVGCSTERVRQIKNEAIQKMRKNLPKG